MSSAPDRTQALGLRYFRARIGIAQMFVEVDAAPRYAGANSDVGNILETL